MSDEPTRAEMEALLHYYQNRAVDGEARLAAAEARIRELERALREIANQTDGYKVWTREDRVCRMARAALAPPPGDEKRGGE